MTDTAPKEIKETAAVDKVSEADGSTRFKPVRGKDRVPVSGKRLKLDASALVNERYPGHQSKWINDEPGEIEKYLQGGWELVEGDVSSFRHRLSNESGTLGSYVHQRVGVDKAGNALFAYLMVIPNELFEEDVAAYHDSVEDRFDTALKSNIRPADGTSAEKEAMPMYDPLADPKSKDYLGPGADSKHGLHSTTGLGKHG